MTSAPHLSVSLRNLSTVVAADDSTVLHVKELNKCLLNMVE